jgi:hypothetical protein
MIYTVYRIERVRLSPIVSTIGYESTENGHYFKWDLWYNFRSKTNFTGRYYIYLDNQLQENKSVVFPKYWLSTEVEYFIEELEPGKHTVTIAVEDEGGHLSTDSLFYDVDGTFEIRIGSSLGLILGTSIGSGILIATVTTIFFSKLSKHKKAEL